MHQHGHTVSWLWFMSHCRPSEKYRRENPDPVLKTDHADGVDVGAGIDVGEIVWSEPRKVQPVAEDVADVSNAHDEREGNCRARRALASPDHLALSA